MRISVILPLCVAVALGACRQRCGDERKEARTACFADEIRLPMTPVKDQGDSELCWIYAMLATIETDRIGMGDSVNMSPDYLARAFLVDESRRFHLSRGKHKITMRGMATAVFDLMERYGVVGFDAYKRHTQLNYKTLARRVMLADTGVPALSDYEQRVNGIADDLIGALPKRVYLYGAQYTPQEFAHSVAWRHDYEALTSFTHHPDGSVFALETPDNFLADKFLNVGIDSLVARIRQALRAGCAVCWEGDTSESGFSWQRGVATFDSRKKATQELRQRHFETMRTTDDHCMAIIGTAHDEQGRPFFIMKNSYGTGNPYGGVMYVSEDYVRMKTIAIVTRRIDRLPKRPISNSRELRRGRE